jgi:DNA-binding transcriptional ArsR family regulator
MPIYVITTNIIPKTKKTRHQMESPEQIFKEINQISIINNPIRFRILLALFNSELSVNGMKVVSHSHTFTELNSLISVSGEDLDYHLKILKSGDLVEKDEKYYHISKQGKNILNKFKINEQLVKKLGKELRK